MAKDDSFDDLENVKILFQEIVSLVSSHAKTAKNSEQHRPHFFFAKRSSIPKISIERHAPKLERRSIETDNYKQWRKMGKRMG